MSTESLSASLGETLALFDVAGEPRTTTEVADALDLGRRSTYERLERLVAKDALATKKVGASARVWWRPGTTPKGRARGEQDGSSGPRDRAAAARSLVKEVVDETRVGAFVLDDEFHVVWIDDDVERYFGVDRDDVVGRDKRDLVESVIAPTVADPDAFAESVLATYDDNTYAERFDCHVLPGDGREERWLEHRSRPIETGPFAGGRVELYSDVTDWKRSELARRDAQRQFESLVDAVEEYAIVALDADGRVRNWNSGASRIVGYDEVDIVGEHVSRFYTESDREAGVPREDLDRAVAAGCVEDEGWRVRADGSRFWATVTITARRDDAGNLAGYLTVVRDMTERRNYERRLEAQAARLERQRDDLQRELDEVFERVDDGFVALDDELRFTYVNDWAADRLDVSASSVVGQHVRDVFEPGPNARQAFEEAFESLDPTTFEEYNEGLDAWFQAHVYPSESGLSVYFQDVTERKERERSLEQYETIVETTPDGVYLVGPDGRLEMVNEAFADLLGYDRDQLVGSPASTLLDDETLAQARGLHEQLDHGTEETARLEFTLETATGDERVAETTFALVESDGEHVGVGVLRDVTEQTAREAELERQASLLDSIFQQVPVNLYLKDEEGRHVRTSTPYLRDEYDDEEQFRGKTDREIYPGPLAERAYEDDLQVVQSGEPIVEKVEYDPVAEDWLLTSKVPWRDDAGEIRGLIGVTRVITEQKRRERALEESKRRYQTLVDNFPNGAVALVDRDLRYVTAGGTAIDDVGATTDELTGERVGDALPDALASVLVPRYRDALDGESSTFEYESDAGVALFHVVPVRDADGEVFAAMGVSQDITERKEAEAELKRHRAQLAAINSVNELFQEITAAVIDQSTRSEIESAVCEGLAGSDSYSFAWFGDVDMDSQVVEPRACAGVDGYLDGLTITVDPDDDRSNGPTGRALRTGRVQTTLDAQADDCYTPWRDHVEEYGFRSSAAIPVVHEGCVYGVLNVYADRANAFEGDERTVMAHLGEVVGHAIAATERKRALLSDDVVELEFQVPDVYADLSAGGPSGTVRIERAIPAEGDDYVVYGAVTDGSTDAVESLVDAIPQYQSASILGSAGNGDGTRFELRVSESPLLDVLVTQGGTVEKACIEDGDYSMRIHVDAEADVRRMIDAVQTAHPTAEMLSRRQTARREDGPDDVGCGVTTALTDRQRDALEAAYHAGFFEWPRVAAGQEIAESLGVSPPTFHQHLRKAERKVFESVLDGEPAD